MSGHGMNALAQERGADGETTRGSRTTAAPTEVFEKSKSRAVAVLVILVVTAAALRGYVPGRQHAAHEQMIGGSAAMVAVVAVLGMSLVIVAIAIITRVRDQRSVAASTDGMSARLPDGWSRPPWRAVFIALAAIAGCLLVVLLLAFVVLSHGIPHLPSERGLSTASPSSGTVAPTQSHGAADGGSVLSGYRRPFLAGTVLFLAMLATGSLIASRRRRPVASVDAITEEHAQAATVEPSTCGTLARAAQLGLEEIGDVNVEPRTAIIACYAAMERALADSRDAVPLDSDTPSEVLIRAVDLHAVHAHGAAQLVNLFTEARFSPHVMNEEHRQAAVRALQRVLNELQSRA